MNDSLKIFCFNWNAEAIRIGESLDSQVLKSHRTRQDWSFKSEYLFDCQIADFLPPLLDKIQENNYDLLVFSMQEASSPGCYFQSHLLKEELLPLDYHLVKRGKLMGVGVTTFKAIKEFDIKMRGLRTSVYAKKSLLPDILDDTPSSLWNYFFPSECETLLCPGSFLTRSKGALAIYITIRNVGTIAIINCHLPFDSERLVERQLDPDKFIEQEKLQEQNIAYNMIYREMVKNKSVDHVIWMGDFNYRLDISQADKVDERLSEGNDFLRELYHHHDELNQQFKKELIYPMFEGVNGEGPLFLPTCKMQKEREGVEYKLGKTLQRPPSWADRILYKGNVTCTEYDRWSKGETMKKSDHDAIIASFFIPLVQNEKSLFV